jgi:hypothetical protein
MITQSVTLPTVLFVAACSSSPTSVRLELLAGPELVYDSLSVAVDDGAPNASVLVDAITVLVPDEWAGTRHVFAVDGLRGAAIVARGDGVAVPIEGEEVIASIVMIDAACPDRCSLDTLRCAGDAVETCVLGEDSCPTWSSALPCPSTEPFCSNGACGTTCVDECATGETQCDGPDAERACGDADADPCLDWAEPTACAPDETCTGDACAPGYELAVALAGSGTGSVASAPSGIDCGADCSETYAVGTTVTLTATPSGTDTFAGWSGAGCTGTGPCTVTVDGPVTVTASFAGACTATCVPEVVAGGLADPIDLRADDDYLYWSNLADFTVVRHPKTGGAVDTLANGTSSAYSTSLDDDYVYWISDIQIRRVRKNGIDESVVATTNANFLTVDATHFYWTWTSTVHARPTSLATGETTIFTGGNNLSRLVADATHLYFVGNDGVRRWSKATQETTSFAVGATETGATGLAVDATHVYWSISSQTATSYIRRRPKTGGPIETIAQGADVARPANLEVRDGYIYWTNRTPTTSAIRRRAVDGSGAVQLVASGDADPSASWTVAVDDEYVYWTDTNTDSVMRLSRCGCGF